MKRVLLLFVLISCASMARANDGVFYSRGGTLVPMQETQVRLQKELLKFFVRDFGYMDVEIDFEFFNPGPARTLTVGFVTPPADGDVSEEDARHPKITNFVVIVNGRVSAYKIRRMKQTSFKMGGLDITGEDFVYYFPVTFKPGTNRIRHTYRFKAGGSVETQRDFDYQITTGKRWANKQIDDFELQIHPDQGIYYIPASFQTDGSPADWQIVGDGVFRDSTSPLYGEGSPAVRMVHLNRGYLLLRVKNFKPDNDIIMGEYYWATSWFRMMCKIDSKCHNAEDIQNMAAFFSLRPGLYVQDSELYELSSPELQIVRNFPFAVRGYEFQTDWLKNFYLEFFWYKPDPTLRAEDISLSKEEEAFVRRVRMVERTKQN